MATGAVSRPSFQPRRVGHAPERFPAHVRQVNKPCTDVSIRFILNPSWLQFVRPQLRYGAA